LGLLHWKPENPTRESNKTRNGLKLRSSLKKKSKNLTFLLARERRRGSDSEKRKLLLILICDTSSLPEEATVAEGVVVEANTEGAAMANSAVVAVVVAVVDVVMATFGADIEAIEEAAETLSMSRIPALFPVSAHSPTTQMPLSLEHASLLSISRLLSTRCF
jgi:hypothetical protein